jgi:methyl-accepting chemotaxis protein
MLPWVRSIGIVPRLLCCFVGGTAIAIMPAIYTAQRIQSVHDDFDGVFTGSVEPLLTLAMAGDEIQRFRARVLQQMLDVDPAKVASLQNDAAALATSFDARIAKFAGSTRDSEAQEKVATLRRLWAAYARRMSGEVLPLSAAGKKAEAWAAYGLGHNGFAEMNTILNELTGSRLEAARASQKAAGALAVRTRRVSLVMVILCMVTALAAGLIIARGVVGPIRAIVEVLAQVARGKLNRKVVLGRRDEMGQMAASLDSTFDSIRGVLGEVSGKATELGAASQQVSRVSHDMAGVSGDASAQATLVSAAAEQVSRNVQTVATAAGEMTSTVREIAKNVGEAANVAGAAMETARAADATIARLGESSAEIGKVVKVITSIAGQTKLLALNATIEAARAGEAGKGFAVVANEVKELAAETARATGEIGQRIDAIQADSQSAVAAISQISAVVRQINEIQGTISSAVEEQAATTSEIDRNVAEAAKASSDIAHNISGLAETARTAATGAGEGQKAAARLAEMAAALQRMMLRFELQ